jgi:hypothetical protein
MYNFINLINFVLSCYAGVLQRKSKKTTSCNTEISIVVATPSIMVSPHNEAMANASGGARIRVKGPISS